MKGAVYGPVIKTRTWFVNLNNQPSNSVFFFVDDKSTQMPKRSMGVVKISFKRVS